MAAYAQPSVSQAVAYIYVANSTEISGYSAAANGRLTAIPQLPVDASVSHLSATSTTLFGPGTDNKNIYSFLIGTGGVLTPGAVNYVQQYDSNGWPGTLGPTGIDPNGLYLYSLVIGIDCSGYYSGTHTYTIGFGGKLNWILGRYTYILHAGPPQPVRFLGNDQYAFLPGCVHNKGQFTPTTLIYDMGSIAGPLYPHGSYTGAPQPSDPQDFYCPAMLAPDPSNHLAYAFRKYYPSLSKLSTPYFLASYTVDVQGNLSTSSNYTNMPAASIGKLSDMEISPDGKLLAVAGSYGFELFHFRGANPIKKITHLMASDPVIQLAWDKAGHLYVLTASSLFVYNATTTGVQLAPGSPYAISGSKPFSVVAVPQ